MLKLLEYGKPNSFSGIIGKPRKLAWPVHVYRVTLPKISNDGDDLNAFERVVLKLLDAVGILDADELADETRIPLDLVKGVLLRLQDKGFVDEYNAIIKREHDEDLNEEDNAPVFVTALLFRELVTGKILPFLHRLDNANPLQKKEGEERDFLTIRWDATHKRNTPTQRDAINALRAMKKRAAVFGMEYKMPVVQQITITAEPELYHLDCSIAIQKSDSEFRIADPFGNGFSLALEKAFEQLLEQDEKLAEWLYGWKQLLSNPQLQKPDEKLIEPFDTESNWQRYPKLIANLRPSRNMPFRSIAKIYASIEWALFYACCHRPFENAITILKFTAPAEHSELLVVAAEKSGIASSKFGFRPILAGKLIDFQNEKAELDTVLAIAILQASNDESHPLRRIAATHSNLIDRLFELKNKRGEKAHGKGGPDTPYMELSDDSFMRDITHKLVPGIAFSGTPAVALDKDVRADLLLDARASIQNEFGFKTFNRLGANLQDRLIHTESFWLLCKSDDDAMCFVSDLYAALQSVFGVALTGKLPPDIDDSELIKTAETKSVNAILCKKLPDSLSKVKSSAIRQTLQGSNQTLGACVITFLLIADHDVLRVISDSQPTFVNDMAEIIRKRDHGNQPLQLPKDEITKLRKSTLTTIKILMES